MNRRVSIPILASLVAVSAACARQKAAPPPEAVPVRVGTVVQKDVPLQIRNVGTVVPINAIAVRALIGGEILQVHFREGQDVKKGDLLFTIDPRPYEAALAQAEAALARDRAMSANADTDVKRYEDLVKKDYVTRQQYDSVKAQSEATQATVRADQAAVERARLDLAYCSIRAPIDGRTGSVMVQVGNVVKANDATLVTINQVAPIYLSFAVPERDLDAIRHHQGAGHLPVDAVDAVSGKSLARGELTFLDNAVDRTTGTITLKGTFANADRALWPGEFVNAELTLSTEKNAVVAPPGAVQNGQQGSYAFVVKSDDTVESRPVQIARTAAEGTVIAKGLSPGDRVVTDGQLRLAPGTKVEILTEQGQASTEAKKS
ncbi:MAG TPA: efflux RND transporter periplasmic adaptor subunit [Thermoanaerobaculia bacterium]